MPPRWRWAALAAGSGLWAWWGWSRLVNAAVPAYGPVAHHLAALDREAALHLLFGALLLLACGLELVRGWRGRRRRPGPGTAVPASTGSRAAWPPGSPAAAGGARAGGIGSRRAETRVHASGR